jgi:putative flippase GtrA
MIVEADLTETSSSRPLWLVQAVKFGAVGVLNTALDLGLYFVLTRWLGLGALPVVAKSISYSAGILNSFLWNKYWTFQSKSGTWATLLPFIVTNLVGLGINTGMLQLCLKIFGMPELVALGLATLSTLAWNFIISKFVVFRK